MAGGLAALPARLRAGRPAAGGSVLFAAPRGRGAGRGRGSPARPARAGAAAGTEVVTGAADLTWVGEPAREPGLDCDALVVGAGPAGLATALMLARRKGFARVRVVDKLAPPPAPDSAHWGEAPERNYNLGLSGRGQVFLDELGVLEEVLRYSQRVDGRITWDAKGNSKETLKPEKRYPSVCIQRDRLTAVLLAIARRDPRIEVQHGVAVASVTYRQGQPEVALEGGAAGVRPALLVGADGFNSAVAECLEAAGVSRLKRVRYEDKNARLFKVVPLEFDQAPDPAAWSRHRNYSAESQAGAGLSLEVLPTAEGKGIGLTLYKPGNPAVAAADTAEKAKRLLGDNFPQFVECIPERSFAGYAAQGDQRLPRFAVCKRSLTGPRTALVGDAVHTVKPYFGMGVNSAFEDISALRDCLADDALADAGARLDPGLAAYSARHTKNVEALVRLSRSFDAGFLTFVLPIILDTLFNKALPRVFSPMGLKMLSEHEMGFAEMAAVKRRDRALQLAVLGALAWAAVRLVKWAAAAAIGAVRRGALFG